MGVGLRVGQSGYLIGRSDYLSSFFYTICHYLENKHWGSKYPIVMKKLYYGELSFNEAEDAINEFEIIRSDLSSFLKSGTPIIWDRYDLSVQTPKWAINPNEEVTTLENYFVTCDGRDLIDVFSKALNTVKVAKEKLVIEQLNYDNALYFDARK